MLRRDDHHSDAKSMHNKVIAHLFLLGAHRQVGRTALALGLLVSLTMSQAFGIGTALAANRAQSGGTIEGTVTDPSSAVVNDATVTLENPVTGFKKDTRTDENGVFR